MWSINIQTLILNKDTVLIMCRIVFIETGLFYAKVYKCASLHLKKVSCIITSPDMKQYAYPIFLSSPTYTFTRFAYFIIVINPNNSIYKSSSYKKNI